MRLPHKKAGVTFAPTPGSHSPLPPTEVGANATPHEVGANATPVPDDDDDEEEDEDEGEEEKASMKRRT